MFVELGRIANVNLGFKSLQNSFFYINQATVETYGIERKFLTQILMLKDLDATAYEQTPEPDLWLFNCKDKEADLRGTGALRYIEAMAVRSAAEKKQAGTTQTIKAVLEAQSGGLWYAPKARPNRHHIWLRKAYGAVFAPYLFAKAALVDQRCNSVSPLDGIEWKELAAALTTSLFAYSLEINGAASMGAGALEAPTTKLRSYPVFDVSQIKPSMRKRLVALAENAWAKEAPIDWSAPGSQPGPALKALDQWIIDATGGRVSTDVLYADVRDACRSRIVVASDKTKKTKKKQTDNVGNVAQSIVDAIKSKLQLRNFPEDFVSDGTILDVDLHIETDHIKQIRMSRLLDVIDLEIIVNGGARANKGTHPQPVADAIVRAVLWGRSTFSVSSDRKTMDGVVTRFLKWAAEIEKDVGKAIAESALGTGYEDVLRREVYKRLSIHPLASEKVLPAQILLSI